jgi:hypothetical protein
MVNPKGKEKGALMVFNPTEVDISRTLHVPMYYSGLTDQVVIKTSEGQNLAGKLDRKYDLEIQVNITAGDWMIYFFE